MMVSAVVLETRFLIHKKADTSQP